MGRFWGPRTSPEYAAARLSVRPLTRFALGFVAAALALHAPTALAHAHLASSSQAANAMVALRKAMSLTFGEGLEPKFSGLTLTAPGGGTVPLSVAASEDRKTLVAAPGMPLAPGLQGHMARRRQGRSPDGRRLRLHGPTPKPLPLRLASPLGRREGARFRPRAVHPPRPWPAPAGPMGRACRPRRLPATEGKRD